MIVMSLNTKTNLATCLELCHMPWNCATCLGTVPHAWKQSHITPVHKGGSTDDPTHYRPIAVVSVVAKVLEKIVAIQLSSYLE